MRTLILPAGATPREWGRQHGETFRDAIAELAAIREELTLARPQWKRREQLVEVAKTHVGVLEAWDRALYEELIGIAEGSGLPPEAIIVLNHYTDLRDIVPEDAEISDGLEDVGNDEGCTVVHGPAAHRLLGMTWDTHYSASQYLMMLGVPEHTVDGRQVPAAWTFTIVGCLAMAGFNANGVGVVINNLISNDARIGVVWPALIRRLLRESNVADAGRVVTDAPIGSGHHYLIADHDSAWAVETSRSEAVAVVFDDAGAQYHHTNHCIDPAIAERTVISPTSSTHRRYDSMAESLKTPLSDLPDLWGRFAVVSDAPKPEPHGVATCGVFAMDLDARTAWAVRGGDVNGARIAVDLQDGPRVQAP